MIISSQTPQQYSAAAFPALKFFLPFEETSGNTFTDIAGGIVCTGALSVDTVASTNYAPLHANANCLTISGAAYSTTGEVDLHLTTDSPLPAPNGKVCVFITVWGSLPQYSTDPNEAHGYMRFGSLTQGEFDENTFTVGINSKDTELSANAFKSHNGDPGLSFIRVTPYDVPLGFAITVDYETATQVRVDNWINATKVTMVTSDPTKVKQFTKFSDLIEMQSLGGADFRQYTMQLWHFDAKPDDSEIARAVAWTRDKAMSGQKAPFPGWLGRT